MANLFDILGPSMVGPSSSHTAGACRLGYVTRALLDGQPNRAVVELHGSFAMTGEGHGTRRAIIGGLLGMRPDDPGLRDSESRAVEAGMEVTFRTVDLGSEAHPNTARLDISAGDRRTRLVGSSIGGGQIRVEEIDGMPVSLSGTLPTLVILADDVPGTTAAVTGLLAERGLNLATMRVDRTGRGERALTTIETDGAIPEEVPEILLEKPWIHWIRALNPLG